MEQYAAYFSPLETELKRYLQDDQIAVIERAYLLAAEAHRAQKRQTGEPYITHPLAVAVILAKMRLDQQSIIAAILHDVIEDTPVGKEQVAEQFGDDVAELVDGVTKLTQMEFTDRAHAQAENFYKMVLATVKDIRVILVKLADRLHNMRTLEGLSPIKRHRIAKETLEIYAPIANRLGMHALCVELEDLAFVALYPLRYRVIKAALAKARADRLETVQLIEQVVEDSLKALDFPYVRVRGRHKHLYSIYRKMRQKKIFLRDVMDIYGFRVVVDSVDNCYRALGIIHSLYKPIPERFKDYIAIPKANGYQALHTTLFGPSGVPIEFQIRTQEMDKMAENGIAAHWLYKSNQQMVNWAELKAREWLRGLIEMQQTTGNSLEFIENVKIDLFPDEIYVFTPNGDIVKLPQGATPVDFAYAVHSEVGNTCVAAKIDRRLAPLSTHLLNGQTVEIITMPNSRPNPAWLDFVVTGKARSRIKHFLNSKNRADTIQFGRQLLQYALSSLGSLLKLTDEHLHKMAREFHYQAADELLEAIGLGNQVPLVVANRFIYNYGLENPAHTLLAVEKKPVQQLAIKGTEGIATEFAVCCRPIPGDPIVGYLVPNRGLQIHREECGKLHKVRHRQPERLVLLNWASTVARSFEVELEIVFSDTRGALAALSAAISQAEADIVDLRVIKRDGGYNQVSFLIAVKDRTHLARVMRRLKVLNQVIKISRKR